MANKQVGHCNVTQTVTDQDALLNKQPSLVSFLKVFFFAPTWFVGATFGTSFDSTILKIKFD